MSVSYPRFSRIQSAMREKSTSKPVAMWTGISSNSPGAAFWSNERIFIMTMESFPPETATITLSPGSIMR